jgi:hypothetical protein
MASVALDFLPPTNPDIVSLSIFEGTSKDGEFTLIETVTEIGEYPGYLTRYTTDQAISTADWFRIQWVDNKGAATDFSGAVQGGTFLLVSKLIDRVMLRDATLDENLVAQVCEWVVSRFFVTETPYDAAIVATYAQLEGLTLLSLARAQLHSLAQTQTDESYTAGLVSQKSGVGSLASKKVLISTLVSEANALLGINCSIVLLLEDIDPTGTNNASSINVDISRLLIDIG